MHRMLSAQGCGASCTVCGLDLLLSPSVVGAGTTCSRCSVPHGATWRCSHAECPPAASGCAPLPPFLSLAMGLKPLLTRGVAPGSIRVPAALPSCLVQSSTHCVLVAWLHRTHDGAVPPARWKFGLALGVRARPTPAPDPLPPLHRCPAPSWHRWLRRCQRRKPRSRTSSRCWRHRRGRRPSTRRRRWRSSSSSSTRRRRPRTAALRRAPPRPPAQLCTGAAPVGAPAGGTPSRWAHMSHAHMWACCCALSCTAGALLR